MAVLGERSALRAAQTRRQELASLTPSSIPLVDIPSVAPQVERQSRTLLSALDEEDRKLELVKYVSMAYRTSFASPFTIFHFSGESGKAYAASHHPLSLTAINHALYTTSFRQVSSIFPFLESPTIRVQAHIATSWLKKIIDAAPLGTIIAYPFDGWLARHPNIEPTAKHLWRQMWAGWLRFIHSSS